MKTATKSIRGTYHNGKLKLERPLKSTKPIEIILTYEEEKENLALGDFSFLETQELLKDCDTSFSETVIAERRSEL